MTNPEKQAAHVERLWCEAMDANVACLEGDCLYAERGCHTYPHARPANRRCGHDHACMGYTGRKHIQHGLPLMRYGICARYQAWAKRERQRIIAEREEAKKGGSGAPPAAEWG